MKIGGRIIRDKFVFESTDIKFDALYKNHRIIIDKGAEISQGNPIYWCEVFGNKNGEYKFKGCVRRCQMHDVIICVLNESGL